MTCSAERLSEDSMGATSSEHCDARVTLQHNTKPVVKCTARSHLLLGDAMLVTAECYVF